MNVLKFKKVERHSYFLNGLWLSLLRNFKRMSWLCLSPSCSWDLHYIQSCYEYTTHFWYRYDTIIFCNLSRLWHKVLVKILADFRIKKLPVNVNVTQTLNIHVIGQPHNNAQRPIFVGGQLASPIRLRSRLRPCFILVQELTNYRNYQLRVKNVFATSLPILKILFSKNRDKLSYCTNIWVL